MNKKIVKTITLGVLASQFTPYMAYANPNINDGVNNIQNENYISNENIKATNNIDWAKEYEDLTIPEKKDMKPLSYSPETMAELSELIQILDDLDTNFQMDKLNEVFKRIFDLNTNISLEEANIHEEYDQIDYIVYRATYFAFTNLSGTEKNEYFVKLADDMYLSSLRRHNSGMSSYLMTDYGVYYGSVIGRYFTDIRTGEILVYLNSMLLSLKKANIIPPDMADVDDDYNYKLPETELPSTIKPDTSGNDDTQYIPDKLPELPTVEDDVVKPEDDTITYPNGTNGGNGSENGNGQGSTGGNYTETEEYIGRGNSCYKLTTKYDFAGNEINKNEQLLPSSEKGFCNILDYEVVSGETWNSNNNGDVALDVWESLGQNEMNKLSSYSIHFSINKNNEKPYYYDSGIRVSNNMTATYTQLRDVLTQISIKLDNCYVIEDNNKLLFISEGKPLVVKDKQAEYSKSEIEGLLKSFNEVELKVDLINQLKDESVQEQANKGELRNIIFGDKTISLSKDPIVINSTLLLPIKEIAENLGLTVNQNGNIMTVSNADNTFEYEVGTKNMKINGNKKILSTTIEQKDDTVYGEMLLLLKEIGYTLNYDSFNGKIEISK